MFIQNPELDLVIAPKGNQYHCKFNSIECLNYIIIKSNNIYELNNFYLIIKEKLENIEYNNYKQTLNYLKNNYSDFEYFGDNNYFINNLENYNNKNLFVAVFCIFETTEEIFELNEIKEIKKIKCSEYNYKNIKTHKSDPIVTGIVNTNNKLTEFFWNIDNKELFDKIYYEVSLWKNNNLIKIYNTSNDSFIFAEHALEQSDGQFELIVVAKDSYDSSSIPASYTFNLKTDIADDFRITMENEYEEEVNVTSLNSPKFKIFPFEEDFDYKIYLNNQVFSYQQSLIENKEYFKIDTSKNCLYFYCPLILDDGKYLLNIEKIDSVGNKTGNYINPMGKYGRTFFSFVISNILPDKPELIDFYWTTNTKCLINFKSNDKTKTFKIFQNNFLIKETFESYCEITPIIETNKDIIIKIFSVNYNGLMSEFPLEVTVKKYIDFIDYIDIKKDNFNFKDNEYYNNNPKPLFEWSIQDIKNLKYYSISLDGSNWIKLKDNRFIFNKPLKDNTYTFRVKAINNDDIEGQVSTFKFKLQTRNLSAPLFDRETLSLKPCKKEDLLISWLKVNNIKNYEYCFNKTLLNDNENLFTTDKEKIDIKEHLDLLSVGINNVMIRTIDYFNNTSNWNALNFIILNDDEILEENILQINLINENTLPNSLIYDFQIPELIGYPFKKLFLISPDGVDTEIIDEFEGSVWTNEKEFDQDGVWQLEVQYFKKINDKLVYSNVINYVNHIYNSYYYEIENIIIENNIIKWKSNNNNVYNYYEYDICLEDFNHLNFNKTYSNEIDINNKFINGRYKLLLKTYSLNNILCQEKEMYFTIENTNNYIEEELLLNNLKIKIKKFLKERIFYITEIKNLNDEKLNGILLFKKVKEQYYNIYNQQNFLNLNTNYNFTFNEVIANE